MLFLLQNTFSNACLDSCDAQFNSCENNCSSFFAFDKNFVTPVQQSGCVFYFGQSYIDEYDFCLAQLSTDLSACSDYCQNEEFTQEQKTQCQNQCNSVFNNSVYSDCNTVVLDQCRGLCTNTCYSQKTSCNNSCYADTQPNNDENNLTTSGTMVANDTNNEDANSDKNTGENLIIPCTAYPDIIFTKTCEGVSADGIANIIIYYTPNSDIKSMSVSLIGPIRGVIVQTESAITYTPFETGPNKNFLYPDEFSVVADYVDKCNNEGKKSTEFTVEQPPVLLVHGILSDGSIFETMQLIMNVQNFQTRAFSYPNTGDIDVSAELLSQEIGAYKNDIIHGLYYGGKEICIQKVDIVAHSMGGLVTRDYSILPTYMNDIRSFVMMGTPNYGSELANLGKSVWGIKSIKSKIGGIAQKQMEVGSDWNPWRP